MYAAQKLKQKQAVSAVGQLPHQELFSSDDEDQRGQLTMRPQGSSAENSEQEETNVQVRGVSVDCGEGWGAVPVT